MFRHGRYQPSRTGQQPGPERKVGSSGSPYTIRARSMRWRPTREWLGWAAPGFAKDRMAGDRPAAVVPWVHGLAASGKNRDPRRRSVQSLAAPRLGSYRLSCSSASTASSRVLAGLASRSARSIREAAAVGV
jgi:hypothetical protein